MFNFSIVLVLIKPLELNLFMIPVCRIEPWLMKKKLCVNSLLLCFGTERTRDFYILSYMLFHYFRNNYCNSLLMPVKLTITVRSIRARNVRSFYGLSATIHAVTHQPSALDWIKRSVRCAKRCECIWRALGRISLPFARCQGSAWRIWIWKFKIKIQRLRKKN